MSDDEWDAWDEKEDIPQLPKVGAPAVAAAAAAPTNNKFAGEDEGEDAPAFEVPKPQESKKPAKPAYEDKGTLGDDDTPLDDPIAEKLRKQRLVEAADLRNAQELFGAELSLEAMSPKSARDFEAFGKALALKHLRPHEGSSHYKALLKAVIKMALTNVAVQETKDLETAIAGIRSEKVKAEAAEKAAKKGGKKKSVNVGSKGGSAGLDDYQYDAALDDDFDFM